MISFIQVILLSGLIAISAAAQERVRIEYLCADWGPAMTWSGKTNDLPQFSETEEEVYFLKQMSEVSGTGIYLCKMKPDGSGKTEIQELWHNVTYPIDTQAQSTWMNVSMRTHKIVLSVTYAGSSLTGLWTLNLNGKDLKRIYSTNDLKNDVDSVNHPSWTPDGSWIVFDQHLKGRDLNQYRIARCDADGNYMSRLIEGSSDQQPSVSPDGKRIAYIHHIGWSSRLYLMNTDKTDQHPLPNPDEHREAHGGTYPTWSPDGNKIFGVSMGIIDVANGRKLINTRPTVQGRQGSCGWAHWGRMGFVGTTVGGILYTDSELKEAKWIGYSQVVECSGKQDSCRW